LILVKVYFKIRAQGGEGIILRYPDSPYVNGYSRFMYKHKVILFYFILFSKIYDKKRRRRKKKERKFALKLFIRDSLMTKPWLWKKGQIINFFVKCMFLSYFHFIISNAKFNF